MKPAAAITNTKDTVKQFHVDHGIIMLCDVSDFVKVANYQIRLHGTKAGSEKTKLWFDQIFKRVVHNIKLSGGEVIQMIGDAVVASFNDTPANQVVECAISIKNEFEEIHTSTWPAQIKTSISANPYDVFSTYSSTHNQLQVILGPAFISALKGNKVADKHDVVIDHNLLKLCEKQNGSSIFQNLRDDFFRVRSTGMANLNTHASVLSELKSPVFKSTNEIKLLTILYIEVIIDRSTTDTLQHLVKLSEILDLIIKTLPATLSGLCETEQGLRFQYLFGSKKSETNEVERAIQFAILAQKAIEQSGLAFYSRVSIGYGHSWQGEHQYPGGTFFSLHGKEINLAARLLERTPENRIYLTESARLQLSSKDKLIDQGLMSVKGEDSQIRYFLVPTDYDAFCTKDNIINRAIGRDAEIDALLKILADVSVSAEGYLIEICGDAGVGKSTLLSELRSRMESRRHRTVELRASPHTQAFPYAIVHPMLSGLAKLNGIDQFENWANSVLADNTALQPLLALLNTITPYKFADSNESVHISPEFKSKVILELCSELVGNFDLISPFILIIEDLQWFDNMSINLLEDMFRAKKLLQCICTIRTEAHNEKTAYLQEKLRGLGSRLHSYTVNAFDLTQTEDYLKSYLCSEVIPMPLSSAIFKLSGGNLLLLNSFLQRILQDRVVQPLTDGSILVAYEQLERISAIPTTLEHAIQVRIDQLEDSQKQVLYNCTIFKSPFKLTELRSVFSHHDRKLLEQQIHVLLNKKILTSSNIDYKAGHFQFEHQLVEQCIYDRIPCEERKMMHLRFANWLEKNAPSRKSSQHNMLLIRLASQYKWAEQIEKAVPLTRAAVDFAVEIGALDNAIEQIDTLLNWHNNQLLNNLSETEIALLTEQKARMFFAQGNLQSAMENYKAALDHLGSPHPPTHNVTLENVRQKFEEIYNQQISTNHTEKIKKQGAVSENLAIRIYMSLGELYFHLGNDPVGHLYLLMGVSIAENFSLNREEQIKAYSSCVVLAQILNNPAGMEHFTQRINSAVKEVTSPIERSKVLAYVNHRLAYIEYSAGRLEKSFKLFTESVEAARRGREYHILLLAYSTIIVTRVAQGRFEDALAYYTNYEKLAEKFAGKYFNVFHQYGLINQKVYALAALRRTAEAQEALARLESVAKDLNFPKVSMLALKRCKLMLLYKTEQWDAARSLALDMANNLINDVSDKAYLFTCVSLPAEVLISANQQHSRLSSKEQTAKHLLMSKLEEIQKKFALARPAYLVLKARCEMDKNSPQEEIYQLLEEALTIATSAGQLVEERVARNLLALVKRGNL